MNQDEKQKLKALFVATALYYSQDLPDAALRLFVEDLADLSLPEVERAISELRRSPKVTRCPLPAVIRAKINPQMDPESESQWIANSIVEAISRVGPYQIPALHPIAKEVVKMEGGWEQVCEVSTNENIGMLKSQWRKLAHSLLERGGRLTQPQLDGPSEGGNRIKLDFLKDMPK